MEVLIELSFRNDGDVLSLRGIWSDEANEEAERLMYSKMSALEITGGNAKSVAKEVFNSFYEVTKDKGDKSAKAVFGDERQKCLTIKPNDITRSFLCDLFADVADITKKRLQHSAKFNAWDKISIPKDNLYEGQPEMQTTIGRYIMNKFVLGGSGVLGQIPYQEKIMNAKELKNLDAMIGTAYMKDQITRDQFDSYIDYRDTFGYWLNGMLAHTISPLMAKPIEVINKKKEELIKKYEKELADHNVDIMTKISDELLAYAKEILKDDPGMDLYLSGDLNFDNNYKNNSVIKGAVKNELTGEFDFVGTSFMDGIDAKDFPAHANSILASQYPASIATEDAGYMGKKLLALMQMMEIDYSSQNCDTKNLIPLKITKANKNDVIYTYFKENGEDKLLDETNIDQYVGKEIMCYSPLSCTHDKVCPRCAGPLFKMLGVDHAGLFVTRISHSALNLGLKAKHRSIVELMTIDPDDIIHDI